MNDDTLKVAKFLQSAFSTPEGEEVFTILRRYFYDIQSFDPEGKKTDFNEGMRAVMGHFIALREADLKQMKQVQSYSEEILDE